MFSDHQSIATVALAVLLGLGGTACASGARAATDSGAAEAPVIMPGDERFDTPDFGDYQAVYTSSSSKTGGFTLHARTSGDGGTLSLVDIIPMQDSVIVAQRNIDLTSHRLLSGAGPYFAWGAEFVVSQATPESYDWARIPIGGGEPARASGPLQHGGYVSEMFSPTLASLMPMAIGSAFRLPSAYPRKGEFVSSELDEYRVLRRERLALEPGLGCHCWVIEKKTWSGTTELIWVAREAPFVFRRHRDVGGRRDFVSDLLAYEKLDR